MNGTRNHFLSRARFPKQEARPTAVPQLLDEPVQLPDTQ